jgi:hypothetical protein
MAAFDAGKADSSRLKHLGQEEQIDAERQPADAGSYTLQSRRKTVLGILGVGLGSLVLEACASRTYTPSSASTCACTFRRIAPSVR